MLFKPAQTNDENDAMWRCSNCNESVEDTFDVCWNCGAAADGHVNSDFEAEPDDPTVPDPGEESSEEPEERSEPVETTDNSSLQTDTPPGMSRRELAALICKTWQYCHHHI